ncbi:MAG TPA: PSD1 and planctomycete cytochrome C domain-containing protein [Cyclobacteriaceae bacterium]|nr:PSD1 and planctomycete cytochrome C domain-containing protein [Cyclobacteriaceae bacterium]
MIRLKLNWLTLTVIAATIAAVALIYLLLGKSSGGEGVSMPKTVDYNFHIRPIISDRCFKCHGPDAGQRKAKLRLDTEQGLYAALKDNPSAHVIVPGDPEASEVYNRISSSDTSFLMPPATSNLKLSQYEIDLIEKWIAQGAVYKKHWAFVPPEEPNVPESGNDWVKNEIDEFVLQQLDVKGLEPNEEADRERLLKRVFLDLVGLPPTLEQQDAFIADASDNAYEKVVDELLTNKHYGEKMAIHWLDVARYADTHGYQDDGLRTMWPWRDWVIHAFNENYPYDKFIRWQLAGDLMPEPSKEMLLATGFNRNHKITQEGGVIDEEYRIEYVTDRTNTFGKAFLALTFECAHCHDHKYDPISQKEYYSTFAFFNQVAEKGYQGDIFSGTAADVPRITIGQKDIDGILNFVNKRDSGIVKVMIMRDSNVFRPTHILTRGAYDAPGETVPFGTPDRILGFDTTKFSKNRLGLANWVLDETNPLTSRVFVNRMWEQLFGRGIVKTSGDFGMQGELPSHPELLDWLATDFTKNNWDIKRLVKQIVMSATYRQSSVISKEKMAHDPENIYLSHAPRMRLNAELSRDLVLASSGELTDAVGGPSVKPYQPKGIWEVASSGRGLTHYNQDHEADLYRRGLYTFIKRTVPPPSLLVFDASNRDQCEVRRLRTNTPLQALVMMNDPQVNEAARVLAETLMADGGTIDDKISKAFRLVLCRKGTGKELGILTSYFESEKKTFETVPDDGERLISIGEYKHQEVGDRAGLAAMIEVIMTLYNMEEAIVKA